MGSTEGNIAPHPYNMRTREKVGNFWMTVIMVYR